MKAADLVPNSRLRLEITKWREVHDYHDNTSDTASARDGSDIMEEEIQRALSCLQIIEFYDKKESRCKRILRRVGFRR